MADREAVATWLKAVIGVELPGSAAAQGGSDKQQSFFGDIADGLSSIGQGIVDTVSKVGEAIETAATTVVETVSDVVETVGEAIQEGVTAIGDGIVDIAASTSDYDDAMKEFETQIAALDAKGLDSSRYKVQADTMRQDYAAAQKTSGLSDRIAAVSKIVVAAEQAAARAKADVARVGKSATEGMNKAIGKLREGAKKSIDALDDDNPEKPELQKRLGELDDHIKEFDSITDDKEMVKRNKVVNVEAQSLFADAAKANNDTEIVQQVYADALKERYGIEISNPKNMPNTHLEQVYQMFDKVPEADVVQDRLKKLSYAPTYTENGVEKPNTGAAYGGAEIEMGDYGDENWNYKDPVTGAPMPSNGFSISTLHELGHSVDDRFGIMNANQSKVGAGGWKSETVASVTAAFVAHFNAGDGKDLGLDANTLRSLVQQALLGTKAAKPDSITPEAWVKVDPLLDSCISRRSDKWPWGDAKKLLVNGRYYHEAYGNDWVSYDPAARAKAISVRDYQWRAPAEYFAELYAYSYFNSKPPPNGVDAALAAYMYGGKAAEAPG